MAHQYPLQAGDRSKNEARTDSSPAGDRRNQNVESVHSEEGTNRAPEPGAPISPLYKIGYLQPSSFLMAPFEAIHNEGDTSGEGTKIYEIEVDSYGDCYDPTAPARVREVGSEWHMDTDHDGEKN